MIGQFAHWSAAEIRDCAWLGVYPARIARMTGRSVPEIMDILAHRSDA